MARVKRGKTARRKHKKILKQAKGYTWTGRTRFKIAKDRVVHAGMHAYVGRKLKKRVARRTWQVQINAATRQNGLTYSKFMSGLKKTGVALDRKVLADLSINNPEVFKEVVNKVK